MDCPLRTGRPGVEATEIFVAYCAGTLPTEQSAVLAQHLQSCPECGRMAAAQGNVWAALDDWTPAAIDSHFDAHLFARIAAERQRSWWRRTLPAGEWSWRPAIPVAAACAALLVAFLVKTSVREPPPRTSVQPRVDIEQVERALDDIDMLKQIGVASLSVPGDSVRSEKL